MVFIYLVISIVFDKFCDSIHAWLTYLTSTKILIIGKTYKFQLSLLYGISYVLNYEYFQG